MLFQRHDLTVSDIQRLQKFAVIHPYDLRKESER